MTVWQHQDQEEMISRNDQSPSFEIPTLSKKSHEWETGIFLQYFLCCFRHNWFVKFEKNDWFKQII